MAALPQERGGEFELTVREVVALGRTPYKRAFAGDNATDRDTVTRALEDVGMEDVGMEDVGMGMRPDGASRPCPEGNASGCCWPGRSPRIRTYWCWTVLDEPTNHLDVRHQVELLALLRAQRRTTLVSLHDLNAAASVCDRLHVLHSGTVVASDRLAR